MKKGIVHNTCIIRIQNSCGELAEMRGLHICTFGEGMGVEGRGGRGFCINNDGKCVTVVRVGRGKKWGGGVKKPEKCEVIFGQSL